MIRRLATPPADWNELYPDLPVGAITVNEVDVDGTRMLAAYWDDDHPDALTDDQWSEYVNTADYTPPPPDQTPITIAPDDLAALQTDLAKAKTVDGLKGVLTSFFDALG